MRVRGSTVRREVPDADRAVERSGQDAARCPPGPHLPDQEEDTLLISRTAA